MVQTLHRILWLAWGVILGKSCFLNSDPRSLPPVHIQQKFIQSIEDLTISGSNRSSFNQ